MAWLGRRRPANLPANIRFFNWNPGKLEMDPEAVLWAEALINLAGASIGETRWTPAGKKLILESRISSVNTLTRHFSGRPPLQAFVGISGAGYYGPGNKPFKETDAAGKDFPAKVAAAWEKAYEEFQEKCRPAHICILRLAVVLAGGGGALPKILLPFRFGTGSELGSGRQAFNWIHLEDAARIIAMSLEWDGIVNISAPSTVNNADLTKAISAAMGIPAFLPAVPAALLRIMLGDRSSLVLEGNQSDVALLLSKGYHFQYPDLGPALKDLLKK